MTAQELVNQMVPHDSFGATLDPFTVKFELEKLLAAHQRQLEEAFKAGYHCRWHRDVGRYCFDPALSPGDPEGAYKAWQESVNRRGA